VILALVILLCAVVLGLTVHPLLWLLVIVGAFLLFKATR